MDILDLLSSGKFLLVNKDLARKIGIDATLLLAELLNKNNHWKKKGELVEFDGIPGYFYATIESIEEETTLTRRDQDAALKRLKAAGFVSHILRGLPAKRYFLINEENIYAFFGVKKISPSLYENAKLECTKTPNCFGVSVQTRPYIRINNDKNERIKRSHASKSPETFDEATVKGVENVQKIEDVGKIDSPKFRNREVPKFLQLKCLSEKDRKMLANQFTDSELNMAIEDAKSYMKKKKIENHAAFLTDRCKEYRKNKQKWP